MPCELVVTKAAKADLLVPKHWNRCFQILEPRVPNSRNYGFSSVGTHASQSWNHLKNCQLPKIGINASQVWKCRVPVLRIAGSETLVPMLWNVVIADSHFEEPPVSKDWNHFSQVASWNDGFQVPGNAGSQKLKLCLVN